MIFGEKTIDMRQVVSLNTPINEGDSSLVDYIADNEDRVANSCRAIREATKDEILELSKQMKEFGVSLTDVADSSPKQERTA